MHGIEIISIHKLPPQKRIIDRRTWTTRPPPRSMGKRDISTGALVGRIGLARDMEGFEIGGGVKGILDGCHFGFACTSIKIHVSG